MGAPATVTVRTELAVPPAVGVTGFVPNTRFKPPGPPELTRVTGAENVPTDCTAIVVVPDVPGPRDKDDGVAVIVKSAAPAVICTVTSAVCVSAPLVPVTRYVNVPVEALELAAIVSVDVAVMPDGGVTGVGSVGVTPAGAAPTHEPERSTAELKALSEVTVHKLVPVCPCCTVNGLSQESEKSGAGGPALVVNPTAKPAEFPALLLARILYS